MTHSAPGRAGLNQGPVCRLVTWEIRHEIVAIRLQPECAPAHQPERVALEARGWGIR
jgi:hypothetical protein